MAYLLEKPEIPSARSSKLSHLLDLKIYFREVAAAWGDLEAFAKINQKYALDMNFDSVLNLCQRFGLSFPKL